MSDLFAAWVGSRDEPLKLLYSRDLTLVEEQ